jgi:hypothetical protein
VQQGVIRRRWATLYVIVIALAVVLIVAQGGRLPN